MRQLLSRKSFMMALGSIVLLLAIVWVFYALFGHRSIQAAYENESIAILNKILAGRESTPVQDYYARADQFLIQASERVVLLMLTALFLVSVIKKPVEMLLACASFVLFSFLLFSVLELFPSLVGPLRLDKLGYYNAKIVKIPDETLGFRYTPNMHFTIHGNRSALYSPSYGVEVKPKTIEWATNSEGFRGKSDMEVSDVVLTGDSFIEYGDKEAETFGKLLEQQLGGWTVSNLGVSGYTPFHYLEVLKRYGVKKKPKVAVFCFYEGNDIKGIREYLNWRKDRTADLAGYEITSKGFIQRYRLLAGEILGKIQGAVWLSSELLLRQLTGAAYTHPNIVLLKLGNGATHRVLLHDQHPAQSTEEMLQSDEWKELGKILLEYKSVSKEHGIRPVVLHIPMTASVYAEYATAESGGNWRRVRQEMLGRTKNMENAMNMLAREVGIEFMNLALPFRAKASEGQLLYEPIDTHWNLAGRKIAAHYVAQELRTRGLLKFGSISQLND